MTLAAQNIEVSVEFAGNVENAQKDLERRPVKAASNLFEQFKLLYP